MNSVSSHFMVTLEQDGQGYHQVLPQEEKERIQELMKQDIVRSMYMNKDGTKLWLLIKAPSQEEVQEVIDSLPQCRKMNVLVDTLVGY